MLSVIYVSVADPLIRDEDIAAILLASRRNNKRHALTGALIYNGHNFMQLLEGRADEVETCLATIGRDPRHFGMVTLIDEPIDQRHFQDWAMGFHDLDSPDMASVPGYSEFLNKELSSDEFKDAGRLKKLLMVFRKQM